MDSTLETWGQYHMQDFVKLPRKFDNKDIPKKKNRSKKINSKQDNQENVTSDSENLDSDHEDNQQKHLSKLTNREDKSHNMGGNWPHCKKRQGRHKKDKI